MRSYAGHEGCFRIGYHSTQGAYARSEEVETTTITRPRTQFRTLTLSVEGFAVATSGLDNTLDAISLEVEEALGVDPSRSNLAKDTRVETIEAEYVDEGERPVGTIRIDVAVEHAALETDLQTAL